MRGTQQGTTLSIFIELPEEVIDSATDKNTFLPIKRSPDAALLIMTLRLFVLSVISQIKQKCKTTLLPEQPSQPVGQGRPGGSSCWFPVYQPSHLTSTQPFLVLETNLLQYRARQWRSNTHNVIKILFKRSHHSILFDIIKTDHGG